MTETFSRQPSVMITGGAGYIGSHLALLLQNHGYRLVIIDNLSTGNAWAVPEEASLIVADILDTATLVTAMKEHRIQTVIHFAAKSNVPESFAKPDDFFETNVNGTKSVIDACATAGVKQLLFSSTAAVYGNATHGLVDEGAPLQPISPYGQSKLEAEQIIQKTCSLQEIRHVTFRFFNVVGAHPSGVIGQYNPTSCHLLQKCFNCVREGGELTVFGHDFQTPDGTAERDYIHVQDLASLHLQAMKYLDGGGESLLLNAGYGSSHSVLEFIKVFQHVTNSVFPYHFASRREGDPASLIADVTRLGQVLEWSPEHTSLEQMIGSSWLWENSLKRKELG